MADEQRDVLLALAQRRQVDGDDIQAIKQVFAEAAVLDLLLELLVGGGQHADIDVDRRVVADASDFFLLQNAEQPALQNRWHGADLIEENRAAIGLLKQPLLVVDRAGERTLAMTEQLGLKQVLGQGTAIDRNERRELPAAVEVQRAGDQFLAGAALAENQDRAVGVRHALDHFEHGLHGRRVADDLVELVFALELFLQVGVLGNGVVVGKRALNREAQVVHLEGLLKIIVGPPLHRFDRRLDGAETGDHDDSRRRVQRAGLLQDVEPDGLVLVEIEVGDDQFRLAFLEGINGGITARVGKHFVTFGA